MNKESYVGNNILCSYLNLLNIKENDYYCASTISTNCDYKIDFRRGTRSCWTTGLGWKGPIK